MAIIRLTTCNNVIDANFIKNKLENENIDCFLTNEISTTLLPGFVGMMNAGIQIMINEEDFEIAYPFIDKPESEKSILCPHCNSSNISYGFGKSKFNKYILLLLSLFTFSPIGKFRGDYYCKDCKYKF
jgi:hypothetical protein